MYGDEDVANIDKPEGIIEAEASEEVARCIVAKCIIAQDTTKHVEYGCRGDSHA